MFLMSSLIFGALLSAIPVVVHLLHRQKTVPIPWAAMMFLNDSTITRRRHRNIDHVLLLLTRMALLALLALLLARPVFESPRFAPLAGEDAVDIGLVIDHSLSMGRRSGDQTLFDSALAQAEKIRQIMRDTDTLSIILAEHTPSLRTPIPIKKDQVPEALDALRQLPPGLTDASIPDALGTARDVINHGRNARKLLLVLSDEQRSGFKPEDPLAWSTALGDRVNGPDKDIPIYLLPVTLSDPLANISVSAVTLEPGVIGANRPAQVLATIDNAGPGSMPRTPVQLIVDGRAAGTQDVSGIAPGQSQTLRFQTTFTQSGSHWVKVQADAVDSLSADNALVAALRVWDKIPLLIIDGQLTGNGPFPNSAFLLSALQPADPSLSAGSLIQPKVVSVPQSAEVKLEDYRAVILNDVPRLPAAVVARLTQYVQSGHGLWVILGPRAEPDFYNQTFSKTPIFSAHLLKCHQPSQAFESSQPPAVLNIRQPDNPALALLTQSQRNAFAGVTFTQWWQLESTSGQQNLLLDLTTPTTTAPATVAASAPAPQNAPPSLDPFAFQQDVGSTGGRVILWSSSVDAAWNNLPLMAGVFVPLANETIYQLVANQSQTRRLRLQSGEPLEWTGPAATTLESATLLRPDGQPRPADIQLLNTQYIVSTRDTFLPGLYQLLFKPAIVSPPIYFSVDPDRRELQPATLSAADLDSLKDKKFLTDRLLTPTLGPALGAGKSGLELWPHAALLLLALLLLETHLTKRAVKLQAAGGLSALSEPQA